MPRNILLVCLSVLALAACQTAAEEQMSAASYPDSSHCYAQAVNDTFLRMCLRDMLEDAEKAMEDASGELNAKARSHDEEFEKRAAVKDLTNSNLAFSAYRDAECTRQAMLGETRQVKDDVFIACKVDMTYERLKDLDLMQQ